MIKDKNQQKRNEATVDAQRIAEDRRQAALRKSAEAYRKPQTAAIAEQLERYRDQKFGLMVHWGLVQSAGHQGILATGGGRKMGAVAV